mgnify:CR=1 FL=1
MTLTDYTPHVPERGPASGTFAGLARELREEGAGNLPDLDLLGLILGSSASIKGRDAARRLLENGGWASLASGSRGASWWKALPPRQGVRLAAALELARRLAGEGDGNRLTVRTPADVFHCTTDLCFRRREHFVGLYCNTRSQLLTRETISVGSLNASIVHPREVFEPAVRHGAASIVVVHNHPSGDPEPSEDDICITRRLAEAGEILGIGLLDHVVVGASGFVSLKESGHL